METKFQTSFIPKKPLMPAGSASSSSMRPKKTSSIFMTLSTLLFIVSLVGAGGAYAWKALLLSSQLKYQSDLQTLEKSFNVDLIDQLKQVNVKIDTARQLLKNHTAASQIFDMIGAITISNVRFLSLDISSAKDQSANKNGDLSISLNGYGTSFSALAFQSSVLGHLEDYGLRRVIVNPILANPTQNQNGTVSFGLTATVSAGSLSYEDAVTGGNNSTGSTSSTTPAASGSGTTIQ